MYLEQKELIDINSKIAVLLKKFNFASKSSSYLILTIFHSQSSFFQFIETSFCSNSKL